MISNFLNKENTLTYGILNSINHPIIMIDDNNKFIYANWAAETFLSSGQGNLLKHKIEDFVPFASPLLSLIEQARERSSPVNEYRVDISSPKLGRDKLADLYVAPYALGSNEIVIMFQERTMTDKIERQLSHRVAARSVTGLAAMLAHEIKNPLSGIRGASQLLENVVGEDDRTLTQLIRDETDRIVSLVDRMEVFSDERPISREPINIHAVFNHVKAIAQAGFASHIKFKEFYDPSLPPVLGNKDQLIQVFLNLVKNAAEAIGDKEDGLITLSTAFRTGIWLSVPGSDEKMSLPLEICVRDNGVGVPADMESDLFEPFVTTKANGTGLGLALVAKIVGAHGGIAEVNSQPGETTMRIMLPASKNKTAKERNVTSTLKKNGNENE